jgi:hypothetical protein
MTAVHRLVLIGSIAILTAGIALATASAANAQAADPAGDFLPTYTGPQNGDLDVLSTGAIYDGTNFRFFATLNGNVGTTSGAFYVWGVDRGAGVAGFGALAPGVLFDTTVIARTSLITPTDVSLATGTAGGSPWGQMQSASVETQSRYWCPGLRSPPEDYCRVNTRSTSGRAQPVRRVRRLSRISPPTTVMFKSLSPHRSREACLLSLSAASGCSCRCVCSTENARVLSFRRL